MANRSLPGWTRINGHGKFETWKHGMSGYCVQHCGHPTALWPFYVIAPGGVMHLAPSGNGFQHLAEAQIAAQELAWSQQR